jgi:hypothetical protein
MTIIPNPLLPKKLFNLLRNNPPIGYRWLKHDEIIQNTDFVYCDSCNAIEDAESWNLCIGKEAGTQSFGQNSGHIRKID